MTASIRDITYLLRQGQLIALADETGWSIICDPVNDSAVSQLLAFTPSMPTNQRLTVLIQKTDQISLYVVKVPDIAYDLVEFAENPLTVVYEQGKNVSPLLNSPEGTIGPIAIRRTLNTDIQRLIGGFGRGLLSIPLESSQLPPAAETAVKERFGILPGMPRKPRIMQLGTGGEVHFIRK